MTLEFVWVTNPYTSTWQCLKNNGNKIAGDFFEKKAVVPYDG